MSMLHVLKNIRQRYHPFFHARRTRIGRYLIRKCDIPIWLSGRRLPFKFRGRALTHGLAFAVAGSQEVGPEAIILAYMKLFPPRSFWDVGSNIGHYSWLVKAFDPTIETVILEPLPDNAALIRATLAHNRFPNATLIQAGASDSCGSGTLHADTLSGATSTLESGSTFEQRHFSLASQNLSIDLVTIDEIRPQFRPIDLMKIDVEGHEESVLSGAQRTLASDHPAILIECGHPGHPCIRHIESMGYVILNADELSEDHRNSFNLLCVPPHHANCIVDLLEAAISAARSSER